MTTPDLDELWIARVTSAALARGRMLHGAAMGLTAATLVLTMILTGVAVRISPGWTIAAIVFLLGVFEFWVATRVAFDADLFQALARDGDGAGLDLGLATLKFAPVAKRDRTIQDRARGALRLLKIQALLVGVQFFIALGGGLMIAVRS